jgi:hypothetical protein
MKKIRVLLADDHRIVLEGLRGLLEPEFEIVGTVGGFGIVRHCVGIGASALARHWVGPRQLCEPTHETPDAMGLF